jgi:hypothetical protein
MDPGSPSTPDRAPRRAVLDVLVDRIATCAPTSGARWLEDMVDALATRSTPGQLRDVFPSVRRWVGDKALPDTAVETIAGPEDEVSLGGWTADEASRAALLVAASRADARALPELVEAVYHEGDSREKRAVIRALPLLPEGQRFLGLALDAGRRSETTLFEAVACGNPFPARHYPELEFNKLVMKAAFVGVALDRIVGLDRRGNPELARMGMDYVSEQESAGRRAAPGIWLAIAPCPPPGAIGRMIGYLNHSVAEQRLGAARGLKRAADDRSRSFLLERARHETEPAVLQALSEAVAALGPAGVCPPTTEEAHS